MKSIILLALICLAAMSELALARNSNQDEWLEFKKKYGKVYDTAEEDARRFSLFMETKERVEHHNANKRASYKQGLNHMSDWTAEEFASMFAPIGLKEDSKRNHTAEEKAFLQAILDNQTEPLDEVDWRQDPNRVSKVKNQGNCDSCWAFATTGVLEGQQVARNYTRQLVPLSEQQLVDCTVGCKPSSLFSTLEFARKKGGIVSEEDYPYESTDGTNGTCRLDNNEKVMTVDGSITLPKYDEELLKKVVAIYGPVVTLIHGNTTNFRTYRSSVFTDESFDPRMLNHAVLIVGYGTIPDEGDYWILKNSWDEDWGDEGFVKMKRGSGMCGIGKESIIPTFNHGQPELP